MFNWNFCYLHWPGVAEVYWLFSIFEAIERALAMTTMTAVLTWLSVCLAVSSGCCWFARGLWQWALSLSSPSSPPPWDWRGPMLSVGMCVLTVKIRTRDVPIKLTGSVVRYLAHKRTRGNVGQLLGVDPNHLHTSSCRRRRRQSQRWAARRASRRKGALLRRSKFDWRPELGRRFCRRPHRGEIGQIGPAKRVAIAVEAVGPVIV